MSSNKLLDQIKELAEPLLDSLGLELWGMELLTGGRVVLRIYIESKGAAGANSGQVMVDDIAVNKNLLTTDSEQDESLDTAALISALQCKELDANGECLLYEAPGAGIDECTAASRLIGMTLEVEDIIPYAYVLEVSTPGLDRTFFAPAQLAAYINQPVEITLHEAGQEYPGRKRFTGVITHAKENDSDWVFSLKPQNMDELAGTVPPQDAKEVTFAWQSLKKARLLYIVPEKPGTPAKKKNSAAPKKTK